jgi:hypothetical protein
LKKIEAISKSSDATPVEIAATSVDRAGVMVESGRYPDAVTEAGKGLAAATGGTLPPGASSTVRRVSLAVTAAAQGRMGDAAGAQKTVEALQQASAAAPDDPALKSAVHFAQGMLAVAQKDQKAASGHFAMCSNLDTYCQWQAFEVSHKAGDAAGADAAKDRLTKIYRRDPLYLYARSRVAPAAPKATN